MGALTYSIKEIIMTTITIKSARYVAITGTIVAIAKNGTRYEHGSKFSPCKGILTAAKITAAGAINDQFWTVLKSEVMVLAHAVARKIVAVEGWSYREALALALSWVMSDVSHARDAIETNGIDWAINYFVDAIFSDGLYEEDEDMLANEIAKLEALCLQDVSPAGEPVVDERELQQFMVGAIDSHTPTVEDVQNFPVLTDAEWDMIENKGCVFTDEEGIDHMVHEPFVPNAPIDMSIPVRDHFAGRSDVKFAMSAEDARAHMLAVLNRTKAQ